MASKHKKAKINSTTTIIVPPLLQLLLLTKGKEDCRHQTPAERAQYLRIILALLFHKETDSCWRFFFGRKTTTGVVQVMLV